jgi:hypothetical protein
MKNPVAHSRSSLNRGCISVGASRKVRRASRLRLVVVRQMLLLSGSNLFPPVVKTCEAGFGPAALVFAREGAPGFR